MKYLKEAHNLYWNEAKNAQYNFYRTYTPNAEKELAAIKNSILELKKLEKDPSLKEYVDTRLKISDGRKALVEQGLHLKELEMRRKFLRLNDFRLQNELPRLISLGSSSEEDFLAAK